MAGGQRNDRRAMHHHKSIRRDDEATAGRASDLRNRPLDVSFVANGSGDRLNCKRSRGGCERFCEAASEFVTRKRGPSHIYPRIASAG
jgi:hypothetical protein